MHTNQRWVLKHRPGSALSKDELELVTAATREPVDGELLVRNIYLSLDPTNRVWMSDREQYLPPVRIGQVMRGSTLGVVEQSRCDRFAPGDFVMPAEGGWQTHVIAKGHLAQKVVAVPGLPLTAHLSVLGATGLTAYFGLLDIGRPVAGETIVISAAAGAVGSIVGQIAKLRGLRVIGIAGGATKCSWITDELGFDAAIDYRAEDVGAALDRLCPEGIDINFENVGGAIMDAVFSRMRRNGRMALCGMISSYNQEGPLPGPSDFGRILMQRLTVRGFIVIDYFPRAKEAFDALGGWIADGRIRWKDHLVQGIEQAPEALTMLFNGKNDGKLVVQLSPEP